MLSYCTFYVLLTAEDEEGVYNFQSCKLHIVILIRY
jgi:hypothetical protein